MRTLDESFFLSDFAGRVHLAQQRVDQPFPASSAISNNSPVAVFP
jgi:hypothetical protein